jgi:hypothetical protein
MGLLLCALLGIYVLHRRSELRVRGWWTPAAGVMIVLALIFIIDPEVRALLMLGDYLGIDLIATLATVYLREHLAIGVALLLIPLLRLAYRWGPVPGFWPHRVILRSSLVWTGYAVICPVLFGAMGVVLLTCLVRPWIA